MSQIGHSATCKACNSSHRAEIDRRLLAGESARAVGRWLKEQGEDISRTGLGNHKAQHLAVGAALKERLVECQEQLDQAVERGLNRVQLLEENTNVLREMRDLAAKQIRYDPDAASREMVTLFTRSASGLVQSVQALQKVHGEIDDGERHVTVSGSIDVDLAGMSDEQLEAYIAKCAAEAGEG